ncbi:MAG TPA: sulfotransferase [Acidimicrobiales bacterium]
MATEQELVDAAVAQAGLEDFGGDSFRAGLAQLTRSLRTEAHLNAVGEAVVYPRLLGHLVTRLQVEHWYARHPEIDHAPVLAPLIGLSLPRTGSTALSFLLAQDPDVRYLRQWESTEPCPPPSTVTGPDPRITALAPPQAGTKDHVPADVHGPMECLDLMALDFRTPIYEAFARIPAYASWLNDENLTSTYGYQRRVLKLLQWGEPLKPWRLKSPAHMLWVDDLASVFPDARFVMTHRDPTDVIASVCDVYADIGGTFTDEVDRAYIGRVNLEQWSLGVDRVLAFRDGPCDERFFDIEFRAMQADPIGAVRGLYEWLGQPVSDEFERRMLQWWEANAATREESVHSDLSAYGLDTADVRPLFADYVARAREWTAHKG